MSKATAILSILESAMVFVGAEKALTAEERDRLVEHLHEACKILDRIA